MSESPGILEALSWQARDFWAWPGWLLALAASILVWRRGQNVLAVHLLLAGWHATILASILGFMSGLRVMS